MWNSIKASASSCVFIVVHVLFKLIDFIDIWAWFVNWCNEALDMTIIVIDTGN